MLSTPNLKCLLGQRQQLNLATSYLDGSQIYGSTEKQATELREGRFGRLRTNVRNGVTTVGDKPTNDSNNNNLCRSGSDRLPCFDLGMHMQRT